MENRITALLQGVRGTPLKEVDPVAAAAVRRRIVDGKAPKWRLPVAAFQSAL